MRRLSLAAVFIAVIALPAAAQNPPASAPTRIRGTIEKLDGHTLTVKTRDGETLPITLAPNFTVVSVVPKTMADIKPGDLVASTSVKGSDGSLRAVEVHILPKNVPGIRIGQFPWDLVPGSLMTNATVAQIAGAPQGNVMKVTYEGKQSEMTVPPGVPIVGYESGDPSLLKPGAAVFITARKNPEGKLATARVTAEKNGVKPPM